MITNLQVNFDGENTFKIEYDYQSDIYSTHEVEHMQFPHGFGDLTKFELLHIHKSGHGHYWSDEESSLVIDKIWEIKENICDTKDTTLIENR
jgi:hypothetical protein